MLKKLTTLTLTLVAMTACATGGSGGASKADIQKSLAKPAPAIDVPPADFPTTSISTKTGVYSVPEGFYLAGTKPIQEKGDDGSIVTGTNYNLKTPLPGTTLELIANVIAFDQPLAAANKNVRVTSALDQYPHEGAHNSRTLELPGAQVPFSNRRVLYSQSGMDMTLTIAASGVRANNRDHFVTCSSAQLGVMPETLFIAAEDKCMQLIMALGGSGTGASGGSTSNVARAYGVKSIAVLPARIKGNADKSISEVLDDLLLSELQSRASGVKVIGSSDIEGMFQLEEMKDAVGCDDTSCAAEIAAALGADSVILTNVGRLGDKYLLTLSWIDQRKTEVINRISEPLGSEPSTFDQGIAQAVVELLSGASS